MSKNSEYVTMMEAQMKKWDAEVDALTARGEKTSAEARIAYQDGIKNLRASRDAAQRTFLQMSTASESVGAQMQAGMTAAWETMQKSFETVSSKLHK